MKFLSLMFCLLVFLLAPLPAAAQSVSLSGVTVDQTGAVIPDEQLTLIHKQTGKARKTMSGAEGSFSFQNVAPGNYILRGEAEGFKTAQLPITVEAQPLSGMKLEMRINGSEEITVTAAGSQPDSPENNADAFYVNNDFMGALPSQSQDILPVISNFLSPVARGTGGPSIIVDGVESGDLNVPTDALKRIYINKNPYSAEFRRPGTDRVEVITRNGSRGHFDGSAALYVRNSTLDAQNAFADEKPDLNRRLFEGSFGGPLPFRRARFFVSGARLLSDESAIVNAMTPNGLLVQNFPTFEAKTNLIGRVDLRTGSDDIVTLVYGFHDNPERNNGVGGLELPEHAISTDDRNHKIQLSSITVLSPKLLNVARFKFERRSEQDGLPASAPEIQVKGAFIGGANQTANSSRETRLELQDVVSYTQGSHTWRLGAAFRPRFIRSTNFSNFQGTFTFPDLAAFESRNPSLFELIQGNPNVSFTQHEAYAFVQDEMKINSNTTLMLGLRYEWQNRLAHHSNLAPRLALAFAPGNRKTVFRLGGGIFYDHLSTSALEQTFLLDGVRAAEFVIDQPSYPNQSVSGTTPSIWRLAPDTRPPALFQASAGVERTLWGRARATVEYQYLRGTHLFRSRDINAPLPVTGVRPESSFALLRQLESTASLRSNALVATLQGRLVKLIKLKAQYSLSRSEDDTDGPLSLPANSYDLRPEWGRSLTDTTNRVTVAAISDLPRAFRLGALLTAWSGPPFNITTGFDDNGDGVANDRPPGITRNTGHAPGFVQLDLRLTRIFELASPIGKTKKDPERRTIELSIDAFNVFNHANLVHVIGEQSSSRFGMPTVALQPRTIQLSLKFNFRANRK